MPASEAKFVHDPWVAIIKPEMETWQPSSRLPATWPGLAVCQPPRRQRRRRLVIGATLAAALLADVVGTGTVDPRQWWEATQAVVHQIQTGRFGVNPAPVRSDPSLRAAHSAQPAARLPQAD